MQEKSNINVVMFENEKEESIIFSEGIDAEKLVKIFNAYNIKICLMT